MRTSANRANEGSPVGTGASACALYLDLWGGAAGDMLLAALTDLDRERLAPRLRDTVERLGLSGVEVAIEQVRQEGFRATRVSVRVPSPQPARSPAKLDEMIAASGLSPWVKEASRRAVARLVAVEARLHGVPLEEVHLHELGAVDTLVDVCGVFALVEALGRPEVLHGPVPLGSGAVQTEHGGLRAPAPAALELLRGRPCYGVPAEAETVTPTGALLLTELARPISEFPAFIPEQVGYGAGQRRTAHAPNLLRAVLGGGLKREPAEDAGSDVVLLLETGVDDSSGELLGHLAQRLLERGALDVWLAPLLMKKGRPGVAISVLCHPGEEEPLLDLLFEEGTTLGVRVQQVSRRVLEREWVTVQVRGESVRVKLGRWRGRAVQLAPEFEEAAAAASRLQLPLKVVYQEAVQAAGEAVGSSHRGGEEEAARPIT